MTGNSPQESLKKQLPPLQSRWLAWLRIRHRALTPRHEEIIQAAAADLIEYFAKHANVAVSQDEINKIGFTILRRRVADQYRTKVVNWADEASLDQLPSPDPSSDPEKVATYSRLLRVVLGLIAKLDRPSRELLLRNESSMTPVASPLTEAERQHRSRLRADLRRRLFEAHGIDLKQLLGE